MIPVVIVPENEHTIGCECAGYVKRIAPGLKTSLKVGDRVVAMRSGTCVNHLGPVGTDDERSFLAKNFGIPENRMFSSRNIKFADEIRHETGGRGIDVILNSLIGELLDES
ncbi:hypothetical protein CHU98_g4891 [Xylaria longipes]|nr:hypothetical protein CHU98_g4891 [Xylaria longipes]